jgi:LPS export ABC transporter protein LptC
MFRVCVAFLLFLAAASNTVAANLLAQTKNNDQPDHQMTDFSLSGFCEKGKKNWDLTGKSADIATDVIKLNDIVSNLYGAEDNVKLTAAKGDFNRQQGYLHLEKDVVVTTSSGIKLTTDSLDWDRQKELLCTKEAVNIEKQDMIITAQGAEGYPDLKKVDLGKDVQVQIRQNESNPQNKTQEAKIIINCDGPLQIDYQKNIATFNNNVVVQSRDAIISGDIMEVYFLARDKDKVSKDNDKAGFTGSQIDKIIARGNVKITRDENVSYSDEAVYNASDRKITLSGRPKLVIYQTEQISASSGN